MKTVMRLALLGLTITVLVISFSVPLLAQGLPPLPHAFYGSVYIDGQPAPAGTVVEARGEGVLTGIEMNPITVSEPGKYGGPGGFDPKLIVQGRVADGTMIHFFVDGVEMGSYPYQAGGITQLDLGTNATPPATGTAMPTSASAATATPSATVGPASATPSPTRGAATASLTPTNTPTEPTDGSGLTGGTPTATTGAGIGTRLAGTASPGASATVAVAATTPATPAPVASTATATREVIETPQSVAAERPTASPVAATAVSEAGPEGTATVPIASRAVALTPTPTPTPGGLFGGGSLGWLWIAVPVAAAGVVGVLALRRRS